jgi:gamma-glutamyltranspeptidase/glutathione hydrolase
MLIMPVSSAHLPGDRPAANPRATRSVVCARHGMIATSQPLASAAGLQVLMEGGNAVDAAVTAAAVLSVVEPTMTGIGGDLFALVFDPKDRRLRGLNASGRSGYAATPDVFANRGLASVPERDVLAVTVPGVVEGWAQLLERHGTIGLARVLEPAIDHARNGFPVSEIISCQWNEAASVLRLDAEASATFLVDGEAPSPGQVFANPRLAATLEQIAACGRDAFYEGAVARALVADIARRGGLLDSRDFAEHRADWVDPISTAFCGVEVFELPPNTQGFVALEMLNLLEGFDLKSLGHNSAPYLHLLAEAKRIAFADRDAYLADPASVPPGLLEKLLSKQYAAARRGEIDLQHAAGEYAPATLGRRVPAAARIDHEATGDTVYLTVVDRNGMAVSLIQSLFNSFGAGIVAGDTGIALQNRGSLFVLKPGHPGEIAPHKRPMHTLVPAMVMKDARPWLSFGVMGGDMQPQGHVQVLLNLLEFGMNVQEAGEAARIRHHPAGVAVESSIPAEARSGLVERGHRVEDSPGAFGGFQGILIDPLTQVLMGASDPRKDGLAIGY